MKILIYANTDWYLFNFLKSLANEIKSNGHEVVLISPDGLYGYKLLDLGFRWVPVPMVRRFGGVLDELRFLKWLCYFLKKERFDIVHSFTVKCAIYGTLAARYSSTPYFVNSISGLGHIFTATNAGNLFLKIVIKFVFRIIFSGNNNKIILLNKDDVNFFLHFKIAPKNNIKLIPGAGVDCVKFSANKTNINNSCRILFPARVLWDKGIRDYIDAARIIKNKFKDVEFLVAGLPDVGNPSAVPVDLINAWVSEGLITWLGHVDDMSELYNSVDVVVLPSYREGLPTGLTEAGACEVPIVASDVPGCRDVVVDGVNGFLVPVMDSVALAGAILKLVGDASLRSSMGKAGRKVVLENFEQSLINDETMRLYNDFLTSAA